MAAVRFAIRALVIGAVLGVLFALRSGSENRRLLRERIAEAIDAIAEFLALPEEPVTLPERTKSRGA